MGDRPLQPDGDGAPVALLPAGHRHSAGFGPSLQPTFAAILANSPMAVGRGGDHCLRPGRAGGQRHCLAAALWVAFALGGGANGGRHLAATSSAALRDPPAGGIGDRPGGSGGRLLRG